MLASINPLGERGRGQRWGVTATAYMLGSAAAATVAGALLGALGALAPRSQAGLGILTAACLIGLAADTGLGGMHTPGPRRQVDERWLARYRGWVYGLGFGAQLGLGVVTIVTSSTVWCMWVAAAMSGSGLAGAAIGAAFGVVRSMPLAAVAGARTPGRLRHAHERLDRLEPLARQGARAVLAAVPVAVALAVWW